MAAFLGLPGRGGNCATACFSPWEIQWSQYCERDVFIIANTKLVSVNSWWLLNVVGDIYELAFLHFLISSPVFGQVTSAPAAAFQWLQCSFEWQWNFGTPGPCHSSENSGNESKSQIFFFVLYQIIDHFTRFLGGLWGSQKKTVFSFTELFTIMEKIIWSSFPILL